jgi:hypothetical protein
MPGHFFIRQISIAGAAIVILPTLVPLIGLKHKAHFAATRYDGTG